MSRIDTVWPLAPAGASSAASHRAIMGRMSRSARAAFLKGGKEAPKET